MNEALGKAFHDIALLLSDLREAIKAEDDGSDARELMNISIDVIKVKYRLKAFARSKEVKG